ncbi:hypothetical protein [Polyangium jinanense]|uniref:Uncharacterized protein n=1 Tax=Polyangium jinanense TaxID=2829994 RepID=A0A9X4B009_9BACT|nr:hypothetical protein [Polyangium jinanense]MDC3962249.1 hypothetical protein [Polyangium jinanense]MDC3988940.1 hypothetical protein [Polyangium jinanense]
MVERNHPFGHLVFDRDAIVRAALRAYVEGILAHLDPLRRHRFAASFYPRWLGDLRRGAFDNGDGCGNNDVVAWTEAGVVGLAFELGWGPIQQLGLSASAVTRGPDDVRAALPGLPDELEPALVMATRMLGNGNHGEKLAGVGFWLYGDRLAGTLFDDPGACGADRLAAWGLLRGGRLPRVWDRENDAEVAELDRTEAGLIHAIVNAVTARALVGPTELTTDELATLLPTPPDPEQLLNAQRKLQKVGITWPGSPEIPPLARPRINPFTGEPFTEAELERFIL